MNTEKVLLDKIRTREYNNISKCIFF
jgi:hypothetical protein